MKKQLKKKNRQNDFLEISEILKSAAHPDRVAILYLLCSCGLQRMTVKNIYEKLDLEQPVASKHLGILKRSGLLLRETEGKQTFFKLSKSNHVTTCISNCLKKLQ